MQKNKNRPGYKRTKVGWIPEDWGLSKARDLMDVRDGTHDTPKRALDGILLVTQKNIVQGRVDMSGCYCISEQDAAMINKRSSVVQGDILMSMIGTVGESALVEIEPDFCIKNVGLFKSNNRQIINKYVIKYFQSTVSRRIVRQVASGGIQKFISLTGLRQLPIPLPSLPEQEAIAGVLECWDKAIREYERKIEKKRNIKKGLMQRLLSGKQRLPGFATTENTEGHGRKRVGIPQGWKEVRLRDLLSYERPDKYIVQDTDYAEHGGTPVLTANKSFILGYTNETFGVCQDIPAIVFDDFTTSSQFADFAFKVKSSAIKLLRPLNKDVDIRFVFERMQLLKFAVGEHKRYYISEYQHCRLAVPEHREQQAIAAVLASADAEIAALERKLAALREQKRFLLNNMVTGTIRLPQFGTTNLRQGCGGQAENRKARK